MFGVDSTELLLIIVVAVVVIGPKDLPRALYKLGQIIGKGRAMTRHFRSGLDAMIREAELEELEKKWAAENARIMAEHPQDQSDATQAALPAPDGSDESTANISAEVAEQGAAISGPAVDAPVSDDADHADAPEQASREAKA
ncbi:Sec-independent protein translocase protein TatB [Sphingobium sp. CR28]|uniref:Sec-independent protein translocase protein TatB n=1 Tax=Sphingobium sp. CR28 TaxID=3400272 RepID=UPI003FEFBC70